MSFIKGVALGNDFVIIDARDKIIPLTSAQIRVLADRRQGVGCDQLILLLPPMDVQADVRLKIYNADGSEAEACGNGTRCVARLLMEGERRHNVYIQTAGVVCRGFWANDQRGEDAEISVTLGIPDFSWEKIPLRSPEALTDVSYNTSAAFCVNVGNPHVVFFVDSVDEVALSSIGPQIENHYAFPKGVNVGFAQIMNSCTLRLRVWERGTGYTPACGTGACAAAVAAIRQKLVPFQSPLRIIQEGGDLFIKWQEGHPITMIGSAQITFCGNINL